MGGSEVGASRKLRRKASYSSNKIRLTKAGDTLRITIASKKDKKI